MPLQHTGIETSIICALRAAQYDQAFRELGVAGIQHKIDFEALPFLDSATSLPTVLQMFRSTGWCGGSVTHPFKEAVVPLLDDLVPTVAAIGACNTVVVRDGRLCGHNTDLLGVTAALHEAGLTSCSASGNNGPDLDCVAVIGVGGVARAVCFALNEAGVRVLRLYDPVPGKADAAAASMREGFTRASVSEYGSGCGKIGAVTAQIVVAATAQDALRGATGVCQCSPVGMAGHPGTPFPVELLAQSAENEHVEGGLQQRQQIQQRQWEEEDEQHEEQQHEEQQREQQQRHHQQWVLDCVYTPVETELIRAARARGLRVITGDRLNFFQFVARESEENAFGMIAMHACRRAATRNAACMVALYFALLLQCQSIYTYHTIYVVQILRRPCCCYCYLSDLHLTCYRVRAGHGARSQVT